MADTGDAFDILAELDQSASEWDALPEWLRPLIVAPYFAPRHLVTPAAGGTDD